MKEQPNDIRKTVEDQLEKLKDHVDDAKERFSEAKDRVSDAAEVALDKSEEAWKDAVILVKKYPGKAVGLALVVGAAIGVLFGGRRPKE